MNYKSKLIEWSQKKKVRFEFRLVSQHRERSESYSPVFDSQVLLEGIVCGEGSGYSKKESHQAAAKVAYKRIRHDKQLAEQVFQAKEKRENPPLPPVQVSATEPSNVELNENRDTDADAAYFSEAAIISIPSQSPAPACVETFVEEELYTREDEVLQE